MQGISQDILIRVRALRKAHKYAEALGVLRTVLPDCVVYYEQALCLKALRRHADAGAAFRQVIGILQRNTDTIAVEALFYTALAYAELNEPESCELMLQQCLSLSPEYAEVALESESLAAILNREAIRKMLKAALDRLIAAASPTPIAQMWHTLVQARWVQQDSPEYWQLYYNDNETLRLMLRGQMSAEHSIELHCQSRRDATDYHIYRLTVRADWDTFAHTLIGLQNVLAPNNWAEHLEAIIELCAAVLLVFADGRTVKVL